MMKRVLSFFLLLAAPTTLFASGLSKPVLIGPKATGMGGAFVAVADDPTAIFHNPAGMTQMEGHHFLAGMDALITQLDYTPPGGTVESADGEFLPVPLFGYVTDAVAPLSLGLGVFFPHGNGGKFPGDSAVPTNPDEGRIYSMEIAPAIAFKAMENLSFGASLRITRISTNSKGQVVDFSGTLLTVDELDAAGWGFGVSLGTLFEPIENLSFGLNYRSPIKKTLSGSIQISDFASGANVGTFDADLVQELPTLLTFGVAFVPLEGLTLSTMYGWEHNSTIESFDASVKEFSLVPGSPTVGFSLPQNWKDSHTIHIGGEYWVLPEELALRAGYAKDLNDSIGDNAMNRVVGDIAAHEVSAGLAYQYERYTLGATWNARFGKRTIPTTATNPGPGHYDGFIQSLNVAFGLAL